MLVKPLMIAYYFSWTDRHLIENIPKECVDIPLEIKIVGLDSCIGSKFEIRRLSGVKLTKRDDISVVFKIAIRLLKKHIAQGNDVPMGSYDVFLYEDSKTPLIQLSLHVSTSEWWNNPESMI